MHVLIAALPEYRWTLRLREHPSVPWSIRLAKANRLQPVVEEALNAVFAPNVKADLTFSTRPIEEVSGDLIEAPERLATGAVGCMVEVLCKEGRHEGADDRWAHVRRLHGRMEPFSFGLDDVFRPHVLRAEIEKWFSAEGWASFGPPRPHRNEAGAPPYGRELLVRHGDRWRARLITPGSFPAFRPGFSQPTPRPEAKVA
jgi:hypothetical protein